MCQSIQMRLNTRPGTPFLKKLLILPLLLGSADIVVGAVTTGDSIVGSNANRFIFKPVGLVLTPSSYHGNTKIAVEMIDKAMEVASPEIELGSPVPAISQKDFQSIVIAAGITYNSPNENKDCKRELNPVFVDHTTFYETISAGSTLYFTFKGPNPKFVADGSGLEYSLLGNPTPNNGITFDDIFAVGITNTGNMPVSLMTVKAKLPLSQLAGVQAIPANVSVAAPCNQSYTQFADLTNSF